MARKYFHLIPIKLALSVYPIARFYANAVANLSITLEGDPIAFPVRIEVYIKAFSIFTFPADTSSLQKRDS